MLLVCLKILAAYLLGSLSGSLLLGRWRGIDIRAAGSGNAGGTNALRTRGWRFALGVVLIDVGKGALAAWLGLQSAGADAPLDATTQAAVCGLAAVVGHVWPLFFGFRGGKGAATLFGAMFVLAPLFVLPLLLVWLLVLLATGYVGLATICSVALLPLWITVFDGDVRLLVFAICAAALIVFTHRGNLARLRSGREHRFERARVFARALRRLR